MNIDLFITQNCNLSCVFCGAWKEDCYLEQDLPFIKHALDVATIKGYKFVTLSGGEPFLHPDILEIIQYAHELGLWVNITTNGLLIDQAAIDKLKSKSVNLRISLHSLIKEKYNSIVKADAFDRVMSTINLLKKNNVYYSLGCTLFEDNFCEIEKLITFAYNNHAQYIRFSPVVGILDGTDYSCDYTYYFNTLLEISKNILKIQPTIATSKNVISDKNFLLEYMCSRPCPAASKSFIIIDTDKNVIPCQFVLDPHYKIPFCNEKSFDSMYEMKKELVSKQTFPVGSKCEQCLYSKKCHGGCWANKITNGLGLNADQPICALAIANDVVSRFSSQDSTFLINYWYTHFKMRYDEKDGTYCFRKLPFWEVNFKYYK